MKIKQLLLITILIMTYIPFITVTLVYAYSMYGNLVESGEKDLENLTQLYLSRAENYILKQKEQLIFLSNDDAVKDLLKAATPITEDAFIYRDIIADSIDTSNLWLFNNKGQLVLGQPLEENPLLDGFNTKIALHQPEFFYYSSINKEDKAAMLWALASPVYIDGSYGGYILAAWDSSFLDQLTLADGLGLIIFDELGNGIYKENIHRLQDILNPQEYSKSQGENYAPKQIDFNNNGVNSLGYYAPIGETGWGLLLYQAKGDLFSPLKRAVWLILFFAIVILISIFIISYYVIDCICKPLNTILTAMRRIDGGDYNERVGMGTYMEYNEIANVFNSLIGRLVNKKISLAEINLKLETLTDNIPGGTQCCYNDEHFTIYYLSAGFLELTGYSRGEIIRLFNNRYAELIYAPDRQKTIKKIQEQLVKGNNIETEYRILRKDGTLRWVLDKGRLAKGEDGHELFYCVVVDITSQKELIENLRLSEERYRLVTEQTDSILFEYNLKTKTILLSPLFNKVFGYNFAQTMPFEDVLNSGLIHQDDQPLFRQTLICPEVVKPFVELEIRMKKERGEYIWCLIQATTLFDFDGAPLKTIGKVKDIDNKKKEMESLKLKAQQDLLTGLYNKEYASFLVQQYLEQGDKAKDNAALFIVDVDDFKSINDKYGHLAGDEVLAEIGKVFKRLFRDSDIVGRIGGDEFMFFIKYLEDERIIADRANRLCQSFSEITLKDNKNFRVSGSVGIAKFPQDAITYKELYNKADIALYKAKAGGKNCFAIYDSSYEQD